MPSRIAIKNEALAELSVARITAEDEPSVAARETAAVYDDCKRDLLESHPWGFATRRTILAEVTNTRSSEWLVAYAVPSDMATPRYLIPDLSTLGLGLPLPGSSIPPYYEVWSGLNFGAYPAFILENGVIYSNIETASLEYGASDINESVMPGLFRRALALEIATRIVMPIKKDRQLKGDLIKQAEAQKSRAMAEDDNRYPKAYPNMGYMNEVGLARSGYSSA